MEVRKKRRLLHNLSLKWSFVLYAAFFIIAAFLLSMFFISLFSRLQNDIFSRYIAAYENEIVKQGDVSVDGEVIQKGVIQFYTEDIRDKYAENDKRLSGFYDIMSAITVPVISLTCLLLSGAIFYRLKLKKPLAVLNSASARIADGDLNFKVEYENRNELGRLAASFEIMRQSLYETNREMWRMAEGRRQLNAAFAHDLRTPLTVLRGYCDFLLKYVPDGKVNDEKAISTLSTMDVYLKRLEGYTTAMSSLQKLEEIELSPEEISFDDLCGKLESAASILTAKKALRFHRGGEGILSVDTAAVLNVFENLISNAARYAENEIRAECATKDGLLSITVADDGSGFSPQALKDAVKPYYRDEKESSGAEHFGIGLYVCRLLCEKHGGTLIVENENGGRVTARFKSLNHPT